MVVRILVLLTLLAPSPIWGQSIEFPNAPIGQVLDTGEWLGAERRAHLENELGRFRKKHALDVMVILWDRGLPPATGLEELAARIGETWAREDLWVVVLHVPDSLHRPTAVFGGAASERYLDDALVGALRTATLRGLKERTPRAQVEALGLEAGGEFVFLKNRGELERKAHVAARADQSRNQENRHQAMIFRGFIATLMALFAVGVLASLYLVKRRPTNLEFPHTRWRRRLGAKWSGGGCIVVSLPTRIS